MKRQIREEKRKRIALVDSKINSLVETIQDDKNMDKEEIDILRKELGLGATGNFPDGKISDDDEASDEDDED